MLRHDKEHQPTPSDKGEVSVGTKNLEPAADMGVLYQSFAIWLDAELERLEERFAHYATPNSRRRSFRRR